MLAWMWGERNTNSLSVGMQTGTVTWKPVWRFLKKLYIDLLQDPALSLMDKTPRMLFSFILIIALFTIARK